MSEIYLGDFAETQSTSCFMKVLYLLFMPLVIFLIIVAGFMDWIPFRVEIHSIVLIGIIFVIYLFFLRHNAFYASCKFMQDITNFKKELSDYIDKNLLVIGQTKKQMLLMMIL